MSDFLERDVVRCARCNNRTGAGVGRPTPLGPICTRCLEELARRKAERALQVASDGRTAA